ncbi:hypothetical protein [Paenibacillus senegalensis]|uniref:hypothetical protein n=1 Tax=Paenibacillus senegalensis TaxID=1465766 RepID=UPI000288B397|nr:hypothetical protein [Paenibacillus senegalensis]
MIGSIRWNLYIGAAAAVITLLSSFSNNILTTTLLRSLYSFLFLFAIMFAFRWFIGMLIEWNSMKRAGSAEDSAGKGQAIDFTTPADESYSSTSDSKHVSEESQAIETGRQEESGDFSPLDPPKLTTKKESSAEEMAQALRHLSEK